MKRQVWAVCAALMAGGAIWIVSMIWKTTPITFAPVYAPHVIGSALTGLLLARAIERRSRAIEAAVIGIAVWLAVLLLAFAVHGAAPHWSVPIDNPATHFTLLALLCTAAAAAAAAVPLRGRPDHPVVWLCVASLLMCGTLIVPMTLMTTGKKLSSIGAVFIFAAPLLAGGLTQVLAPVRRIWICGGGAWIFVLILIEKGRRGEESLDGIFAPLLGMGMFILLGALGARIAWRLFRNQDPHAPSVDLPTARAQGDV